LSGLLGEGDARLRNLGLELRELEIRSEPLQIDPVQLIDKADREQWQEIELLLRHPDQFVLKIAANWGKILVTGMLQVPRSYGQAVRS
jgi:hypothetical protein